MLLQNFLLYLLFSSLKFMMDSEDLYLYSELKLSICVPFFEYSQEIENWPNWYDLLVNLNIYKKDRLLKSNLHLRFFGFRDCPSKRIGNFFFFYWVICLGLFMFIHKPHSSQNPCCWIFSKPGSQNLRNVSLLLILVLDLAHSLQTPRLVWQLQQN